MTNVIMKAIDEIRKDFSGAVTTFDANRSAAAALREEISRMESEVAKARDDWRPGAKVGQTAAEAAFGIDAAKQKILALDGAELKAVTEALLGACLAAKSSLRDQLRGLRAVAQEQLASKLKGFVLQPVEGADRLWCLTEVYEVLGDESEVIGLAGTLSEPAFPDLERIDQRAAAVRSWANTITSAIDTLWKFENSHPAIVQGLPAFFARDARENTRRAREAATRPAQPWA